MVAAIDWRSHTTHDWIWFVSLFSFFGGGGGGGGGRRGGRGRGGVNGPLRHISVYIGPSPKERERKEKR